MTRRRTVAGDRAAMARCFARVNREKKLKVRVELTIEVDVESYRANYGAQSAAEIRNEVKYAVLGAVTSGAVLADGILDAELSNA